MVAIGGRFGPFAVTPAAPAAGASTYAAIAAAVHGVLRALYPNRSAQFQPAYDQRLAAIPDGSAKTSGIAIGVEVAAGIARLRAKDGGGVTSEACVPDARGGQLRAANPQAVWRFFSAMRPLPLGRLDQFQSRHRVP